MSQPRGPHKKQKWGSLTRRRSRTSCGDTTRPDTLVCVQRPLAAQGLSGSDPPCHGTLVWRPTARPAVATLPVSGYIPSLRLFFTHVSPCAHLCSLLSFVSALHLLFFTCRPPMYFLVSAPVAPPTTPFPGQ